MRTRPSAPSLHTLLLDLASGIEAATGMMAEPGAEPAPGAEVPLWIPLDAQPGRGITLPDGRVVSPQRLAYESYADELFYGGAPGGGKSQLILGLAATRHRNSAIFRRQSVQFHGQDGLWEKSRDIIGLRGRSNDSRLTWKDLPGGRALEFLGCDRPADVLKYKGRGHDLKAFDELPEFPEKVYRFLIGWLRTAHPGQRTRVVGAGNPPVNEEGQWVIRYWGPWLDPTHPHPAKPGELRWFITNKDGHDVEVPGPTDGPARAPRVWVEMTDGGEWVEPRSRTFVGARAQDNPYFMATGYEAVLNSLPEPLRSQMRLGNFQAGLQDDEWQVLPMAWVLAAQARWRPDGREDRVLSQVGNDPSRGGQDEFAIALRYEDWVADLVVHQAKAAPDGLKGARLLKKALLADGFPDVPVQIDIGGSAGSSVYDQARVLKLQAVALNGSMASKARDRSGKLRFVNKRAEWFWKFREMLDPLYEPTLALPPDPQLRSDLCATRWSLELRGIQMEDKEAVKGRLGRSPDRGESVIYACVPASTSAAGVLFSQPDIAATETELERLRARLGISRPGNGNGGNGGGGAHA